MSDKTNALTAIAEQLTRIADMMEADRKPGFHYAPGGRVMSRAEAAKIAKPMLDAMDIPVTEEPPVGTMVTEHEGVVRNRRIFRRTDTSQESWASWSDALRDWRPPRWAWSDLRGNVHLTTDAERKAVGIPLEDSEPAEYEPVCTCGDHENCRCDDDSTGIGVCPACGGDGESGPYGEDRTAAAHRAAKAAGMVAIKPSPGSSASSYRRAADALEYNPSSYHLDCAAETYRAIADAIEAQEGIE